MIVVNASNTAKAWEHIVALKGGANVRLKDISSEVGLLAVQGPQAESLLQPLTRTQLSDIGYYRFASGRVANAECFISRTGYTGEDGFELYCRERDTPADLGGCDPGRRQADRVGCAGLTAAGDGLCALRQRDRRYHHPAGGRTRLDREAGQGLSLHRRFCAQRPEGRGVTRKLVGFQLQGRGFPRHGYPVYSADREVDIVRSGTMSPSLGAPIGTSYLPAAAAKVGTKFEVEMRGERMPAEVVSRPFWKRVAFGRRGSSPPRPRSRLRRIVLYQARCVWQLLSVVVPSPAIGRNRSRPQQ